MTKHRTTTEEAKASIAENLAWTRNELKSFPKRSGVLAAIRRKCLDCSGWNDADVRDCKITRCALWPFRMGGNPFRVRK